MHFTVVHFDGGQVDIHILHHSDDGATLNTRYALRLVYIGLHYSQLRQLHRYVLR